MLTLTLTVSVGFARDFSLGCRRYNEPTGVKYAKVRCLALLADPNTAEAVIGELGEYAADIDPLLARQAIRAVGKICLRLPGSAAAAIERLIDLMGMDVRERGERAAWARACTGTLVYLRVCITAGDLCVFVVY